MEPEVNHGLEINWPYEEMSCVCGWEPDLGRSVPTDGTPARNDGEQFMDHLAEQMGEKLSAECTSAHPGEWHVDEARGLLGMVR